ncbi:rod shape-determining protein MreD [Streptococcus sp. 21WXBC0057M1]|uniref:Rod shape-determining protein MreD n=1 Tax=Streptococcus wuxiensis TaxID=3095078 RepID=A0ABU5FUG9_9STRE|nr:rod shape-determining protein MreD [Streptococcus sp. 21WXBC0057M1]MDY4337792.1 rod shape-determining protein MreD [Streptococcus sp. 21WXBC0057M1]
MRLFKQIGMFLLLPVIILIDSHLGQFVNSFFPHLQIVSHFIFIFLLFETIEVSEYLFLAYCLVLGLIYDIYFFHLIGIASLLFVIIGAIVYKSNSVILLNRWTRLLAILMMTFTFEFGSFILAHVVGLTAENLPVFIVYSLGPTMILNFIWMIVFQYIFEKIYI